MNCFQTKKHYCPVCLTEKKGQIKCKICSNTVICSDCIVSMCEKGQCDKCPVCRQEDWKQNLNKKTIIPFSPKKCLKRETIQDEIQMEIEDEENIRVTINWYELINTNIKILKLAITIALILFICWLLGLFITLLLFDVDLKKNFAIIWFPFIVMSVIAFLITCCFWDQIKKIYCM